MDLITQLGLPSNLRGKSFAEAAKKIEKMFDDRNSPVDLSTKKTLMQRLRDAQEQMKSEQENVTNSNNINTMSCGGKHKAQDGMILPNESVTNVSMKGIPTIETSGIGVNTPYSNENYKAPGILGNIGNWAGQNKGKLLGGIGLGLMGLPLVLNEINRSKLERPAEVQPNILKGEVTPEFVNTQQVQRNLVNQLAGQRQALQEQSGGNFGQYAANLQSLHSGTSNALANATLQANLANAEEKKRVQQANLGIDQFNLQQQTRANELTAQNEAAYQSQLAAYDQSRSENIANLGKTLWNYQQSNQYVDSMGKVLKFLGLENLSTKGVGQ